MRTSAGLSCIQGSWAWLLACVGGVQAPGWTTARGARIDCVMLQHFKGLEVSLQRGSLCAWLLACVWGIQAPGHTTARGGARMAAVTLQCYKALEGTPWYRTYTGSAGSKPWPRTGPSTSVEARRRLDWALSLDSTFVYWVSWLVNQLGRPVGFSPTPFGSCFVFHSLVGGSTYKFFYIQVLVLMPRCE